MSSHEELLLSLIVATVGRVDPLYRLLESLAHQAERRFEVILVDQNPDDRLFEVEARYTDRLEIRRLRSERGLSRARNVGLRAARGRLVGIPDDDCWYDPEVVSRCVSFFESSPSLAGLTGVSRDEVGHESGGRFDREAGFVDRHNVFRRGLSTTLFFRTDVALALNGFDESLGLGSGTRWGSGEETDFVLRCLERGHGIYYDPTFVVRHPQVTPPSRQAIQMRGRSYGRGYLRVLKLHGYSRWFMLQTALRPMAGAAVALARLEPDAAAMSFWSSIGRLDELRSP